MREMAAIFGMGVLAVVLGFVSRAGYKRRTRGWSARRADSTVQDIDPGPFEAFVLEDDHRKRWPKRR
jgi:hypothetical protein